MQKNYEKYLTFGFVGIAMTFVGVSWISQGQIDGSSESGTAKLSLESAPLVGDEQYGGEAPLRADEITEKSFAKRIFSNFGLTSDEQSLETVARVTDQSSPEEENVLVAHGTSEDVDKGFGIETFVKKWKKERKQKEEDEEEEEEREKEQEREQDQYKNIASVDMDDFKKPYYQREDTEEINIESRQVLIQNASRGGSFGQIIKKSNEKLEPISIRAEDAIQRRMLDELQAIQVWAKGERLIFSEMGISNAGDDAKYIALANKFFEAANPMGFSVMGWAAGDWWGGYNVSLSPGSQISTTGISGPFVNNPSTNRYVRGLNLAGGEFGMGSNGDGDIGSINVQYTYHAGSGLWKTMKDRGFTHARFPFRLERLFNTDGSFNENDKRLFLEGLSSARAAGMKVLLDPHNYGTLQINGNNSVLERSAFTQSLYNKMMRNLAQLANENSDIVDMIGLMNEPKNLDPKDWERQAQSALDAVRSAGFTGVIEVPTGYWQGVQDAPTIHPNGPWIDDPLDNIMYGVHHYFDRNHSGSYQRSYAEDERDLRQYYSPGTVTVYGVK